MDRKTEQERFKDIRYVEECLLKRFSNRQDYCFNIVVDYMAAIFINAILSKAMTTAEAFKSINAIKKKLESAVSFTVESMGVK